jgi:hypothetical protein
MYKTISNEIIRKFNPCYDPSKFITDETEELTVKQWVEKYRNVVPTKDIIWLLLRREFMSKKDLILFVVWCARESLKLNENPDKWSVKACNLAERYANGEITKDDVEAARLDAYDTLDIGAYTLAYHVYYAANYYADSTAAYIAVHVAASDAAYANYYADYDSARSAQLDKLLAYFE